MTSLGRSDERARDGAASRGRFRLHIQQSSCALVRAKIFQEQTDASERGEKRQEGVKLRDDRHFKYDRVESWRTAMATRTHATVPSRLPAWLSASLPRPSSSSIFLQIGGCIPNWRPPWRRGPTGARQVHKQGKQTTSREFCTADRLNNSAGKTY